MTMQEVRRRFVTWAVLTGWILGWIATGAAALPGGAALEGRLTAVDGRAAEGWRLHLIDDGGVSIGGEPADARGHYAFADVPPGSYALGVEDPQGRMAPVAAKPLRLSQGQRLRHDVKLVTSSPEGRQTVAGANYGLGMWWAGLSPAAKTWVVLGGVAIVGVSVVALDSDDDEIAGSPF